MTDAAVMGFYWKRLMFKDFISFMASRVLGVKENDISLTETEEDRKNRVGLMIDKHGSQIKRMAYSYLHNMEDAEDILQETLIRYIKKAPLFQDEEYEKAWLLHVAANLSKNKIKYNDVRRADELNEELVAEEKKDLSFVWEAVKELPEIYREVIHLFYQEQYSTDQIAVVLNMKGSTVRSRLKRGREALKTILKEEYDFEN